MISKRRTNELFERSRSDSSSEEENETNNSELTKQANKEKVFKCERILRSRKLRNGCVEYYLKWFGYSDKYNSWEPEENIL